MNKTEVDLRNFKKMNFQKYKSIWIGVRAKKTAFCGNFVSGNFLNFSLFFHQINVKKLNFVCVNNSRPKYDPSNLSKNGSKIGNGKNLRKA